MIRLIVILGGKVKQSTTFKWDHWHKRYQGVQWRNVGRLWARSFLGWLPFGAPCRPLSLLTRALVTHIFLATFLRPSTSRLLAPPMPYKFFCPSTVVKSRFCYTPYNFCPSSVLESDFRKYIWAISREMTPRGK